MITIAKRTIRHLCVAHNAQWLKNNAFCLLLGSVLLIGCQSPANNRTPAEHIADNTFTFELESLVYPGIVNTWACKQNQTLTASKNKVKELEKEFEKYMAQRRSNAKADRYLNKLMSQHGCQVVGLDTLVTDIRLVGLSERGDDVYVKCFKTDRTHKPSEAGKELTTRAEKALEFFLARQAALYRMVRSDYFEIYAYEDETETKLLNDYGCKANKLKFPIATRPMSRENFAASFKSRYPPSK